jgi:uncharacterized membrane protein YjdF
MIWGLVLVSALANGASFLWQWYEVTWWYDKALHAFTCFAATLAVALILRPALPKKFWNRRLVLILTLTGLGLALGAVWEMLEWWVSWISKQKSVQESRMDAMTDMFVDTVGALFAALASLRIFKER